MIKAARVSTSYNAEQRLVQMIIGSHNNLVVMHEISGATDYESNPCTPSTCTTKCTTAGSHVRQSPYFSSSRASSHQVVVCTQSTRFVTHPPPNADNVRFRLGQVLLSRFIINLRQVDTPSTNATTGAHRSRMASPNFRVPTMDEVVGNLGAPLDFVEYCVDDGDGDGADGEHVDSEAERASTDGARRSSVADIEAGTSFTLGDDGE